MENGFGTCVLFYVLECPPTQIPNSDYSEAGSVTGNVDDKTKYDIVCNNGFTGSGSMTCTRTGWNKIIECVGTMFFFLQIK